MQGVGPPSHQQHKHTSTQEGTSAMPAVDVYRSTPCKYAVSAAANVEAEPMVVWVMSRHVSCCVGWGGGAKGTYGTCRLPAVPYPVLALGAPVQSPLGGYVQALERGGGGKRCNGPLPDKCQLCWR